MTRHSWAAIVAIIVVAAGITLGLWNLGTPARERQMHQDANALQALDSLATDINGTWDHSKTMPADLNHFVPADATKDPTTHAPFTYHHKDATAYELCATFLTSDLNDAQSQAPFWRHSKGLYCFELDASHNPPPVPFSFTY